MTNSIFMWVNPHLSVRINSIGIHQRLEARCVLVRPGKIQIERYFIGLYL